MRGVLLVVPFAIVMLGCGMKEEAPAADTMAAAAAPAPAMLTEADVAGTWTGTTTMEGSDSVISRWTQVCGGGTCKGTTEGQADTITATYVIDGDSAVGTSAPFMDPTAKANVVLSWVVRVSGGTASGTGVTKLAANDSVVARTRFTGTRAQ